MTGTVVGPRRIVCLTEEPTEVLYALGEQDRIVGISGFTVRPPQARREKPKVSAFTSAKIDEILKLEPDFVVGFSDIQADIAAELVRRGVEVWIANHRSVAGILDYVERLGALVGQAAAARFGGAPVPRPPRWGGLRLQPARIEFWYGADYRLHERRLYEGDCTGAWHTRLLYP